MSTRYSWFFHRDAMRSIPLPKPTTLEVTRLDEVGNLLGTPVWSKLQNLGSVGLW